MSDQGTTGVPVEAQESSPPPKSWKRPLSQPEIVHGLVTGIAFIVAFACTDNRLPVSGILELPLIFAAFFALLYIGIALHEAGHALAAKATGMTILSIHIGNLEFLTRRRGFRWRWGSKAGAAGRVRFVALQPQFPRAAVAFCVAAGPLMNLLLAGLLVLSRHHASGGWQVSMDLFAIVNVYLAVISLLPMHVGYDADGLLLWKLFKNTPREDWDLAYADYLRHCFTGSPSGDAIDSLVARMQAGDALHQLFALWVQTKQAQRCGDWQQQASLQQRHDALVAQLPASVQPGVALLGEHFRAEFAYMEAMRDRSAAPLLAQKFSRDLRWHCAQLPLRVQALAAMLNGDGVAAEQLLVRAEAEVAGGIDLAAQASERQLAAQIRALA